MKRASWVWVAVGCGAACTAQIGVNWTLDADADGYGYGAPDAGDLGIDGVCSITPATANCWRPDGTPDATITSHVEEHLAMRDFDHLRLAYRRPNLLMIGYEPDVTKHTTIPYFGGVRTQPGPGLFQEWTVGKGSGYEYAGWLPAKEGATTAEVLISVTIPLEPQRVRLGKSGAFRVGDYTVTLGKYGIADHPMSGDWLVSGPLTFGGWRAQEYTISPDPAKVGLALNPVFLGKDGKPLQAHWLKPNERAGAPGNTWIGFQTSWSMTGTKGSWSFQGDPKLVAGLEVHPTYTRWVRFPSVALAPKQ